MHIRDILAQEEELALAAKKLPTDPSTPFPILTAKIKLTWSCNLFCEMCAIWRCDHREQGTVLPAERVMNTLKGLHAQGLRKVHFSGGEVLLYDEFKTVVEYARSLDLQVNMTTNGTLLNKDWARFFVDQRVHTIAISIDSPHAKEHDRIRGSKGAWKASMRAIDILAERRKKKGRGPKIAVNTLVSRTSIPHLSELHQLLKKHQIDSWRLLPLDTDDRHKRPTATQWMELAKQWDNWGPMLVRPPIDWSSERSARRSEKGKFAGVFYPEHRCFAPWFNLFVDADGKVYPCCMGKAEMIPFGTIHQTEIADILQKKSRWEMQCSFAAKRMYPICEKCDDFLEENLTFQQLTK